MKLKKRESEYFELLVRFEQAKGPEEKRRCMERLSSFAESKVKLLSGQQYRLLEKWYFNVIREVMSFYPFRGDFAELGRKVEPPIEAAQAREAVEVLETLGLIRKTEDGAYERLDPIISTGYDADAKAIRDFQAAFLDLAKDAMDRFPREKRSISTLTLSLSEDAYKTIEEEMKAFRRKLLTIAKNEENVDRVMQFNFQIFPLSKF